MDLMGQLFDVYMAVDWSARSSPSPKRPSVNAVWIAERPGSDLESPDIPANGSARYFRTRAQSGKHLHARLVEHVSHRRRVLVGFDFPLGFPNGFSNAIGLGKGSSKGRSAWRMTWDALTKQIRDDGANRNNRFDVAAEFNRQCTDGVCGPFWGHPRGRSYTHLGPRSPACGYPVVTRSGQTLERLRIAETRERRHGIQSIWKLYGPASVGSQALLGIPTVHSLREASRLARHTRVWPLETGFTMDASSGEIVFAEVWPNLFPRDTTDPIRDRAQVKAVVHCLAALDKHQSLTSLFSRPTGLDTKELERCLNEEAWILGAGQRDLTLWADCG